MENITIKTNLINDGLKTMLRIIPGYKIDYELSTCKKYLAFKDGNAAVKTITVELKAV